MEKKIFSSLLSFLILLEQNNFRRRVFDRFHICIIDKFARSERRKERQEGRVYVRVHPNVECGSRFRCPEKAGRNVVLLSRAASRIRNLVNSPETVNSGTFDSPVVYSAVRLPTSSTQITDATDQRYFVQMARWRIVHTNEDPPDRINRKPQHHEYRLALGAGPGYRADREEPGKFYVISRTQ